MNLDAIKAAARDFVKTNRLKVPISKEELMKAIKGVLYEMSSMPSKIHGYGFKKRNKTFIVLNARESRTRKLEVIAHEIGHCVLHDNKYQINFCGSLKHGSHKEATIFASELLVPDQHLRKTIGSGITDPRKIAKIYGVPVSMIRDRITELQTVRPIGKVA